MEEESFKTVVINYLLKHPGSKTQDIRVALRRKHVPFTKYQLNFCLHTSPSVFTYQQIGLDKNWYLV